MNQVIEKIEQSEEELRKIVREKYSEIALAPREKNSSSCCGSGGCSSEVASIFNEDYSSLEGYNEDADLGLGCGIPTQFANIKSGDVIVDLGSGAGNDAFVARSIVGENGKVIGIDMTEAMIAKARINNDKLGFNNVEFRLGEIEKLPVGSNTVDVVLSNCVLNLVPNKEKAFSQIHRILKPGGHFCISDIVLVGELPANLRKVAEMYAGCVSGALQKEEYMKIVQNAGFQNVSVKKDKQITIPKDILSEYLSNEEIESFYQSKAEIRSITVYAEKEGQSCCSGNSCC
ncbi:MAG: arsenite methyltransferase [Leptospiraceae bacterium]|nr:arsenite methyltransferase [Leptospiraceae bacterium]MCP5493056.1 arsenite methyltransferase [Leptospiraceae bacterium]